MFAIHVLLPALPGRIARPLLSLLWQFFKKDKTAPFLVVAAFQEGSQDRSFRCCGSFSLPSKWLPLRLTVGKTHRSVLRSSSISSSLTRCVLKRRQAWEMRAPRAHGRRDQNAFSAETINTFCQCYCFYRDKLLKCPCICDCSYRKSIKMPCQCYRSCRENTNWSCQCYGSCYGTY